MDYREDSIYYSDEELFWSESEDEVDSRPVCMGCSCQQKACENLMPSFGYVQWDSGLWDVQDYIELSARLLSIGVKLEYQCARCINCQECIPAKKMFLNSVEYQVISFVLSDLNKVGRK